METALYFPYIQVPKAAWFTQVLLYWDDVASIIPPSQWKNRQDELSPYMNDLIDNHMLNRASPDELASRTDGDTYTSFTQRFLELLDSQPRPTQPYQYVRIHTEKLPYLLFQDLRGRGLVQNGGGTAWQESWWFVEKHTANLYMSYLAGAMSDMSPGTVPVTDRRQGFGKPLTGEVSQKNAPMIPEHAQLRFSMIANALPAPRTQVPADELRRFKDINHDSLLRCRKYIDLQILNLAGVKEPNDRSYALSTLAEQINEDIEQLRDQMNQRRWPKVVMVGVGGLVAASLGTGVAVATGGASVPATVAAIAAGAIPFVPAAYDTAEAIRTPRFNRKAHLAYAALASRL